MRTAAITQSIRRSLRPTFRLSVQPDFPNLVTAPEILIGGEGILIAVFLPTNAECQDIRSLLTRLVLCRLGLPPHLLCVLVQPAIDRSPRHQIGEEAWEAVCSQFDVTADTQDLSTAVKKLADSPPSPRVDKSFLDVRKQCYDRYSLTYTQVLRYEAGHSAGSRAPAFSEQIQKRGYHEAAEQTTGLLPGIPLSSARRKAEHRPMIWSKNQDVVGFEPSTPKLPPKDRLRLFLDFGVHHDYILDRGVPYFHDPIYKVLVWEELPQMPADPHKLIRAAAFGGWALIGAASPASAERFLHKLATTLT